MRVGMFQLALGKQLVRARQRLDHRYIRRTFFTIGQNDVLAAKQRQIGAVAAIRFNVIGHRQAKFQTQLVIIIAVAGGGVHKPRAGLFGDVIAGQHRHPEIPFGVIRQTLQRMRHLNGFQQFGRHIAQPGIGHHFGGFEHALGQRIGHHQLGPHFGAAILGHFGNLIQPVGHRRIKGDGAVLRNGPRSSRPDQHRYIAEHFGKCLDRIGHLIGKPADKRRCRADRHHRKLHPDHVAGMIVVFHFGLGQRSFLNR